MVVQPRKKILDDVCLLIPQDRDKKDIMFKDYKIRMWLSINNIV